jgi:hypothetical protein
VKVCPTCNRSYADETLNFCLDDGATLASTADPRPTQRVAAPRSTNEAPTEVLYPSSKPSLQSTIRAPPPPPYPAKQPPQTPQKRSNRLGLMLGVGLPLMVILVVGLAIGFIRLSRENGSKNRPGSNVSNSNTPPTRTPNPQKSVSPSANTNTPRGPTAGEGIPRSSMNACFASDPAAGSTDRNGHYAWAQKQDAATLKDNLNAKAALLFRCRSMDVDQLSSVFANISVIVARYVPDANCFGGDRGVVNTKWSDHKGWGMSKGANAMLNNLQFKMAAALKCMDRPQQNEFFADVSVAMAGGSSQ